MQLSGDLYLTRKCSLLGIGDREKETEREIERQRDRETERVRAVHDLFLERWGLC